MSPVDYSPQLLYNAGASYMDNLGMVLMACMEARISKNTTLWFNILDGIYSQYHAAIAEEHAKAIKTQLDAINQVLYPSDTDDSWDWTNEERQSTAWDQLRKVEPTLMGALYDRNLLGSKTKDPRHAVATGDRS